MDKRFAKVIDKSTENDIIHLIMTGPGREGLQPPIETVEQTTSTVSIAQIRSVDRANHTSGHELIQPEEAKERNLQNAFVEVLASSGIPFETAFEIADVAWDIHQIQTQRRDEPTEPAAPRVLTPEEQARKERWDAMTQEERDAEGKAVWDMLEAQPGFHRSMTRATRDVEQGRYFSGEILGFGDRIPKLKVVKKSEAARRWGKYENRIPNLKERLTQARQDLIDGKGTVLLPDGTGVPIQEYLAQQAAPIDEQVLVDNTVTSDAKPIQ